MSYKTELQSNNVDLQGILDKVNALPEMEEAPELPTLSNPAAAAQILSGYEVLDQHGIKLTGIMEDNGAVSQTLNAGGSYTIPAGYHNGSGKVTGNSLASQTSATAAAGDIASGKTAWVNGVLITGTGVISEKVKAGQSTNYKFSDSVSGTITYVLFKIDSYGNASGRGIQTLGYTLEQKISNPHSGSHTFYLTSSSYGEFSLKGNISITDTTLTVSNLTARIMGDSMNNATPINYEIYYV